MPTADYNGTCYDRRPWPTWPTCAGWRSRSSSHTWSAANFVVDLSLPNHRQPQTQHRLVPAAASVAMSFRDVLSLVFHHSQSVFPIETPLARPPGPQINISASVFCVGGCAELEFRGGAGGREDPRELCEPFRVARVSSQRKAHSAAVRAALVPLVPLTPRPPWIVADTTVSRSVGCGGSATTLPLPCCSTAFVAKTAAFLVCSTAFAAKTLPLPCVFHCLRG